jgi:hypothetical protein
MLSMRMCIDSIVDLFLRATAHIEYEVLILIARKLDELLPKRCTPSFDLTTQ